VLCCVVCTVILPYQFYVIDSMSNPLYESALTWEEIPDSERAPLRNLIQTLVNYPCKLACEADVGYGSVDIFVWSISKQKITDWFEIQENGAIGVVEECYPIHISHEYLDKLHDLCESYNKTIGTSYISGDEGSESESESDEKEG
jgi:hypothetical protein